jgi:putative nucleotidyltransferase with HDIG domain
METSHTLPARQEAEELLYQHVTDPYQRLHALMVATALAGYAEKLGEDPHLWYVTGYLHDIDFQQHPTTHPGESIQWFTNWQYPPELIHAVHAHAYGYNGYTTEPATPLASALIACDELCGIFYAYRKMNPIPYGEMKHSSLMKKFRDAGFAPNIKRSDIIYGCEKLGVTVDEHVQNMIQFLAKLP